MSEQTAQFARQYAGEVCRLLQELDLNAVESMADALLSAWRTGARVLFMGNGGSSSSVSHIVNDLQKNVQLTTGRPLRALCLTDSTPLLMAWANDTEWSNVFAPQVACWAEPGDMVIGVSGSGSSMNVVRGLEAAARAGARTMALAGFDGGLLKQTADLCLVIPCSNMQQIEDAHMVVLHILFSELLRMASAEAGAATAAAPSA